ncbi:MIP/aquaporin family protein [Candidatus Uabimicrobium amorphum]|uniref:Aquaporin n=1 Tax=Uabimicrobium amorphum TaxID=2596890 RepID=A0A5S9IN15_UABAM|nr:aquaporin [Candidatus Uabimicrobium amorphum]BBM84869.1 aquaporin [Candidatus Uabimicrobium amorphum]
MRSYAMEFIGTMFLVLAIGLTGDPWAIGAMLTALIYMGAYISGAHYNPAVTIAIWMRSKKLQIKDIVLYILAQVTGAFVAAAICYYMTGKAFVPKPGAEVTVSQAMVAEILFTFLLVTVILNVATTKKLDGNYIYGLAIGLTVTAGALCVGKISGAVFNPAVGLGPIFMDALNNGASWGNLYIYIVGPLAGGILSAVLFRFFNSEEFTS